MPTDRPDNSPADSRSPKVYLAHLGEENARLKIVNGQLRDYIAFFAPVIASGELYEAVSYLHKMGVRGVDDYVAEWRRLIVGAAPLHAARYPHGLPVHREQRSAKFAG